MNLGNVVSAELVKIRTVPSYLIASAVAVLLCGLGALSIAGALNAQGTIPLVARGDAAASQGGSATVISIPSDVLLYLMMVIGVLIATADLRNGTLRISSMMVPWRGRLLAGKFAAAAVLGLVVALAGLAAGYVGGLLGAGGAFAPFAGDGPVVLLAILLAAPFAAVLGVSVGLLLRSTAAAVSTLLIWGLGVEQILVFVLPQNVAAFLPFKTVGANASIIGVLGPLPGLAVFAVFVALVAFAATAVHSRRDLA